MSVTERLFATYFDAKDDQLVVVGLDPGVGPTVVFDGGAFMDAERLRAVAAALLAGADWLERGGR